MKYIVSQSSSIFPILAVFMYSMNFAYSQNSADGLTFKYTIHDFGRINESDGDAEYVFEFENTSNQAITIQKVQASCGCTTPDWTREQINPGGKGFIKASYATENRPGSFDKNLTVYTDYNSAVYKLYIKGEVIPRPKSLTQEFPIRLGSIRMENRVLNFGRILNTEAPTIKEFRIYNEKDSLLILSDSIAAPSFISVKFDPYFLKKGEIGKMIISYDAKKANDFGFRNDNLTFFTSEIGDDFMKSISVYANIEEYFKPMSAEEIRFAPLISLSVQNIDLGKVTEGEKVTSDFIIYNNGKSPLIIRKIDTNCSCIQVDYPETEIKPGKSMQVSIAFDTRRRKGIQQKSITVYSNTPQSPIKVITIKSYVDSIQ